MEFLKDILFVGIFLAAGIAAAKMGMAWWALLFGFFFGGMLMAMIVKIFAGIAD